MNRKDRRKVVSDLIKRGKFKRNGMENLFLYNPDSGIYEMISTSVANIKIRQAVNELIEKNEIDEEDFDHTDVNYIIKELSQGVENYVSQLDNFTPTDYIVTKKCRVNLQTGMTEAFNPNAYDTVALDFTYNELSEINEKSETAKFLKSSLGIEKVNLSNKRMMAFCQIIGYLLSNLPLLKKLIIFLGSPNCGKSLLLKFLVKVLGTNHCRALSLSDLTDRYRSGLLENARLITCHEIKFGQLKNLDKIKALVGGDPITVESKFVQAWTHTPTAKIAMAANALPTLGEIDAEGAFADRLLILPFQKHGKDNDPELLEKLYQERDTFLTVVFKSMEHFIKNGMKFNDLPECQNLIEEYKTHGNNVQGFVEDNVIKTTNPEDKISLLELYEHYTRYCKNNLMFSCTGKEFRSQLIQLGWEIKKTRVDKKNNPVSAVIGLKFKPV